MSRLLVVLVVGLCGLELVSASCFSLLGKSNEQRLDCHLRQTNLDKDADLLMIETAYWYGKDFEADKTKDPDFAQFLADVISLKEASLECSDENVDKAAKVASKTKANLTEIEANKNLAKFMIAEFLARFSAKCERRFAKPVAAKLRQLDASTLDYVSRFAHSYATFVPGYESVRMNPRKSLPTTAKFTGDMRVPFALRMTMGREIYANYLAVAGGDDQVVSKRTGHYNSAAVRSLYRKYFVGACNDYLKTIDDSTFEDFHLYLEKFGQPGKSQYGGFPLLITSWIDLEVCKNIVDGKMFLETILSIEPYLFNRSDDEGDASFG